MTQFDTIDREFLRKRAALKWGRCGEDVIPLSVADIDFPVPKEIKEAIIRAVEEDRTPYSTYGGDADVVEVICEKLHRVNGIPATPDNVHMVPGTMSAIFFACYYSLRPGDEAVITPAPVYGPFMENIKNAEAVPVYNPIDFQNGVGLDIDDLRHRITPRTKLLMVCNPHNPTGRVITREELSAIGEVALEHDLLIFSDELYEDMIFEGEHVSLASLSPDLFERTLTVFGFSKAFGMPGYRIAYLVFHQKRTEVLRKRLHDIFVHADTLAQAGAKAALTLGGPWLKEFMAHLREMRDYAHGRLSSIPGVACHLPQATPFLFPDLSSFGMTSSDISQYLEKEARVIVISGSAFGPAGEGYVRLNVATSRGVLEEAMDRMENALRRLPCCPSLNRGGG